jgi:hypothetical protein
VRGKGLPRDYQIGTVVCRCGIDGGIPLAVESVRLDVHVGELLVGYPLAFCIGVLIDLAVEKCHVSHRAPPLGAGLVFP